MNKDQLASVVAAEVGLSQSDAKKAVEAVNNTIDYAEIEKIITDVATKNQFKLLETLGEVIIETIRKQYSFKSIKIKIAKNKIIKSTEFVGVIIER
jgi:dihydroneopterin aldolase